MTSINLLNSKTIFGIAVFSLLISFSLPSAMADHNGSHTTPCDELETVGGGALGNSPGPVGPPTSLGWDVGSGQCNGSFSTTTDATFPGGAIELGLRAEERRVGQVAPISPNNYEVQLGNDNNPAPALNRAWWNFQPSIAYNGNIDDLDELTLTITTDVGPNEPTAPVVDLLPLRGFIDARNNQANPTSGFADLYQISQNPEFGWFTATSDTDANPTGDFDYDVPGAWQFTLTAVEQGQSASVTICIHTPGEQCKIPSEHFLSYQIKETNGTEKFDEVDVTLSDQFIQDAEFEVKKPYRLLNPVDKNEEGLTDTETHLVGYKIKVNDKENKAKGTVLIENQFGELSLDLKREKLLLVPSAKAHDDTPDELDPVLSDHFKCYDVKVTKNTPKFEKTTVSVFDPNFDEERDMQVKKPRMYCNPVEKEHNETTEITNPDNHLVCYDVKKAQGEDNHDRTSVFTNNQFGEEALDTKKEKELCVPSTVFYPDNDNDGVNSLDDPDDIDPCNPDPQAPACLAIPPFCAEPPADMIGWWTGDGDSTDFLGNSDGTAFGDTTFAPGQVGDAFALDGDGDYVVIANESDFDFEDSQFAVDGWFNTSTSGERQMVVTKSGATSGYSWQVEIGTNNKLVAGVFTTTGSNVFVRTSTDTLNDGTWHHFAVNFDNSKPENVTLYIDGVLDVGTVDDNTAVNIVAISDEPVIIGARNIAAPQHFFTGMIDEVEIFDRPLTASEVEDIYEAGTFGKCKFNLEHFLSYQIKESNGSDKFDDVDVTLSDQFVEDAEFEVKKPYRLLNPVDKNDEGLTDEVTHYVGYKIKVDDNDDKAEGTVLVKNQFGIISLDIKREKLLLVPSAKSLDDDQVEPLDPEVNDHLKCYDVKVTKNTPKFEKLEVEVDDPNFEEDRTLQVKKPRMFCNPVEKIHNETTLVENPDYNLVCYDVKKANGEQKHDKRKSVFTNNQFGLEELDTKKEKELCVPSFIIPQAVS